MGALVGLLTLIGVPAVACFRKAKPGASEGLTTTVGSEEMEKCSTKKMIELMKELPPLVESKPHDVNTYDEFMALHSYKTKGIRFCMPPENQESKRIRAFLDKFVRANMGIKT